MKAKDFYFELDGLVECCCNKDDLFNIAKFCRDNYDKTFRKKHKKKVFLEYKEESRLDLALRAIDLQTMADR